MITISPFSYPKGPGNSAKLGMENFEAAKKEIEGLYRYDSLFEGLEKASYFEEAHKNDALAQIKILLSEIRQKHAITEKLGSLSYNIKWLRSAILIKDGNIAEKAIKNILKHEGSSINAIISELNSLKSKISELESLHENLSKSGLSLDVMALLEQDFREKREKLNELHNKQKSVLLSLSSIFVNLAKNPMLRGKNK